MITGLAPASFRPKPLKPPENGNRIIYDRGVPGFGARITANQAISFVLEYSIHGRQRRYTIGPGPSSLRRPPVRKRADSERD